MGAEAMPAAVGLAVHSAGFGFEEQAPGPGFDVSYQPASTAKIEDASGNPIDIDGDAFLVVKLNPAIPGGETRSLFGTNSRVTAQPPSANAA